MGIAAKHSSIRKLKSRFMVKSFRFAGLLRNLVVEGAFVRTAPPNQSREMPESRCVFKWGFLAVTPLTLQVENRGVCAKQHTSAGIVGGVR